MKNRLFFCLLMAICSNAFGSANYFNTGAFCCPQHKPLWSGLFYWGKMTENNLGQVMRLDFNLANDTLYSLELGRELDCNNPMRHYLQPIVDSVEVMANFTLLDDAVYGSIYEINPYFAFRWTHFPWQRFLCTSIALGEGVSYVTRVPFTEQLNSDEPKKFLNFLLFELTFALPPCRNIELVARVHHRSGAFGLYHANNSGSTAVGLGLRYRF